MTLDIEVEVDDAVEEAPPTGDDRLGDERLRGESIAIVRQLILKAHPELVEELVVGESLTELMASVGVAQAAYRRIAEATRSAVSAPVVPAGGNAARLVVEDLGPDGLILRGMKESRKEGAGRGSRE